MRKPVLPIGQTGSLGAGGKSLHELLKGFAGDEFDRLRGPDLDFLARFWVHAGAGLSGSYFESAESDELNRLGFLDARLDAVNDGIYSALSVSFAGSEVLLDGGDEFDFVHLDERKGGGLV
jgi:hypothetical protein